MSAGARAHADDDDAHLLAAVNASGIVDETQAVARARTSVRRGRECQKITTTTRRNYAYNDRRDLVCAPRARRRHCHRRRRRVNEQASRRDVRRRRRRSTSRRAAVDDRRASIILAHRSKTLYARSLAGARARRLWRLALASTNNRRRRRRRRLPLVCSVRAPCCSRERLASVSQASRKRRASDSASPSCAREKRPLVCYK